MLKILSNCVCVCVRGIIKLFLFIFAFILIFSHINNRIFAIELQKDIFIFGEGGGDYSSADKNLNFRIGQVDLFGLLRAGKAEAFLELVFEPEQTGEYFLDAERLYVGYMFHRVFTLRVGRFHTPFGYFTRVWHHGLYLMPQISRPLIIEFEDFGGPLPIHLIGVEAEGNFDLYSSAKAGYVINFGDGNLQFGSTNIGDFDKFKTIIGKIFVSPVRFSEIGISVGYDPFTFPEGGTKVRNLILGGNLVYHKISGPMAIIEGFLFNELEGKKTGIGGFVLLSYGFEMSSRFLYELRPYLQVEFIDWENGNRWFTALSEKVEGHWHSGGLTRHTGYSAGVRLGITPETAIKFEVEFLDNKNMEDVWFFKTSVGFGIPLF